MCRHRVKTTALLALFIWEVWILEPRLFLIFQYLFHSHFFSSSSPEGFNLMKIFCSFYYYFSPVSVSSETSRSLFRRNCMSQPLLNKHPVHMFLVQLCAQRSTFSKERPVCCTYYIPGMCSGEIYLPSPVTPATWKKNHWIGSDFQHFICFTRILQTVSLNKYAVGTSEREQQKYSGNYSERVKIPFCSYYNFLWHQNFVLMIGCALQKTNMILSHVHMI